MYLPRTLETFTLIASTQFPVLMVTGARHVGKTTLLQYLATDRAYVTLDDPMVLSLARNEPALFMQRFTPPLLIDEIQYAPGLLPYIKMAVDSKRQTGMFWLTGSQPFHLMQGVSESLAGRVAVLHLLGLSRNELLGRGATASPFLPLPQQIESRTESTVVPLDLHSLYRLIWRGAFPAVALHDEMERDLFYSSYVQTYLQRDLRDLARVGDELAFLRFMRATAARSGQMLKLVELARDADIAPNTAKSWLSILQASGLIYLLEPYSNNLSKRMVKTPKLYFLDTGLCSWLTEWSSPETLEAGAMSGAILETWIMAELLKGWWHTGKRAPFYYYRDNDQKEIDLLILQDGTLYPLEFKKSASPGRNAVRHFRVLQKFKMPVGPGGVICLIAQPLPLTTEAMAIPVGLL